MASLFTSWISSNKLTGDADQSPSDPVRVRALSSASSSTHMAPIDRATSMTPKAHFQFGPQPGMAMSAREHHREASEATLHGRDGDRGAAEHPRAASTQYDRSLTKPGSRPNSVGNASDLSHERLTAFSSTLGGVDSEAAWSATQSEAARSSSAPRRRKKLAPPELLVIVKPPPSKQANPLNLQIQLVMPQQLQHRRDGSQRRSSMESSIAPSELPTTPSTELRRRDSITSTRSAGSEVSTSGSVASTGSGRRVTPLYNLNFHHILSTTVSDAGTDQKVAKYVRKGIDLDGFGILEPAELINGVNDLATLQRNAAKDQGSSTLQVGHGTNISPRSETNSYGGVDGASAFSAPAHENVGSNGNSPGQEPPTSFEAMTPEARGVEGNLGGKLLGRFKRFSLGARPSGSSVAGSVFGRDSTTNQEQRMSGGASGTAPTIIGKLTQYEGAKPTNSNEIPQLTPGAGIAEGKRTEGYVWTVRKWNRKAHDGLPANFAGRTSAVSPHSTDIEGSNPVLTSVWKRFNIANRMGGSELHPPPSQIPVRFEWSRNSKRSTSRQRAEEAQIRLRSSASLNASNTSIDHPAGLETSRSNASLHPHDQPSTSTSARSLGVDEAAHPRLSSGDARRSSSRPSSFISGHRSPRHSVDTSAAGSSAPQEDEDSGADSDPEDSETPWNCHLVLGPTTRIPLGTLSPAPHHPKLVGQLAVPFPLPDLSSTGLGPDGAGLTREELKDVIIVTCLHLIIRESFGGLARRNGSVDAGTNAVTASMANVNGWRLASIPKKQ